MNKNNVSEWLLEEGNNFCAIPYSHMAIESDGSIRPCCMGDEITDENGDKLNISGKTIDEAFNHPARLDFIKWFDENKRHPACSHCWKANTKFSTRVKFSLDPTIIDVTKRAMDGEKIDNKLYWLEIKPGNRCNLKCRICGTHNSSQWAKDDFLMSDSSTTFKQSRPFIYTKQCDWIDQDDFWEKIDSLSEVRRIHFMGGEPFMVPEHFKMLEALITDENINHKVIEIKYNTNGTFFPTAEQLAILDQFKIVDFALSIDDVGERFEYQRKLADWKEVDSNIRKFVTLDSNNYSTTIDATVNLFNILYLDDLLDYADDVNIAIGGNHFVQAGKNDISRAPAAFKEYVNEKYKNTNRKNIKESLEYMNTPPMGSPTGINSLISYIEKLDKVRREQLSEYHMELFELLHDCKLGLKRNINE